MKTVRRIFVMAAPPAPLLPVLRPAVIFRQFGTAEERRPERKIHAAAFMDR
jgi:hypothetical protein